jgi:hypothetical protein
MLIRMLAALLRVFVCWMCSGPGVVYGRNWVALAGSNSSSSNASDSCRRRAQPATQPHRACSFLTDRDKTPALNQRADVSSCICPAGNPKYVVGPPATRGSASNRRRADEDGIPRPMSIKERVEHDRQLEAAAQGETGFQGLRG